MSKMSEYYCEPEQFLNGPFYVDSPYVPQPASPNHDPLLSPDVVHHVAKVSTTPSAFSAPVDCPPQQDQISIYQTDLRNQSYCRHNKD